MHIVILYNWFRDFNSILNTRITSDGKFINLSEVTKQKNQKNSGFFVVHTKNEKLEDRLSYIENNYSGWNGAMVVTLQLPHQEKIPNDFPITQINICEKDKKIGKFKRFEAGESKGKLLFHPLENIENEDYAHYKSNKQKYDKQKAYRLNDSRPNEGGLVIILFSLFYLMLAGLSSTAGFIVGFFTSCIVLLFTFLACGISSDKDTRPTNITVTQEYLYASIILGAGITLCIVNIVPVLGAIIIGIGSFIFLMAIFEHLKILAPHINRDIAITPDKLDELLNQSLSHTKMFEAGLQPSSSVQPNLQSQPSHLSTILNDSNSSNHNTTVTVDSKATPDSGFVLNI